MVNSVVVMGGSFNPPTRAHFQLMEAAMEAVGDILHMNGG